MIGCSLENFPSELFSRNFCDKKRYESHKLFLGRAISHCLKGDIESLSHEQLILLISSLAKCASSLRLIQDQIREDKLHRKESVVLRVWVWLKNRLFGVPTLETLIHSINTLAMQKGCSSLRVRTSRFHKFRQIVRSVKNLGKGATIVGARVLHESYRREPLGLHLIIDGKSYQGAIYMGFFQDEKTLYWKDWRTARNEKGVFYRHLYSFEDYMNQEVIPRLGDKAKSELIRACSDVVEYYTLEELRPLEVHFSQEGILFTSNPLFNVWAQKIEEGSAHQPSFREFVKTSLLVSTRATTPLKKRAFPFIYVLTTDKKLYIQVKQRGKAHHTSLSRGNAVLSAGEIRVNDDSSIESLNPFSGHYWPGNPELISMLEFLHSKHVDIDRLLFTYTTDSNGHTATLPRGTVSQWLAKEHEELLEETKKRKPDLEMETLRSKSYAELLEYQKKFSLIVENLG